MDTFEAHTMCVSLYLSVSYNNQAFEDRVPCKFHIQSQFVRHRERRKYPWSVTCVLNLHS